MTVDLVIFDCDGVLIDSEPLAIRTLCRALSEAGASIGEEEAHRLFTGHAASVARRICAEKLGIADPDAVLAAADAALFEEFARALRPMPGMTELVASLDRKKCVASNSTLHRLRNSLGLFDLWDAFAPHVFSAEMVARPKPAPDLFFLCARTLGVDPGRCLVVDDSPQGIAGAVAAGMRAIGFVDPADPRAGRHDALAAAGATMTVTGAPGLARAFGAVLGAAAVSAGRHEDRLAAPA